MCKLFLHLELAHSCYVFFSFLFMDITGCEIQLAPMLNLTIFLKKIMIFLQMHKLLSLCLFLWYAVYSNCERTMFQCVKKQVSFWNLLTICPACTFFAMLLENCSVGTRYGNMFLCDALSNSSHVTLGSFESWRLNAFETNTNLGWEWWSGL